MSTKDKEKEAIATVADDSLALAPAIIDFEGDSGAGMEEADKDTFAIPFLSLLQANSPKVMTVDGAKQGMLINTITDELFKEVLVIPCAFQRRYIRWAPRSTGGGYKGELMPTDVETGRVPGCGEYQGKYFFDVPDGATLYDKDGKPLFDSAKDTRNHFVLFQSIDGTWSAALMSLASSLVKKSKRWMSRIQGIEIAGKGGKKFNPPSFSHIYKIVPVIEEKNGDKWWSVDIQLISLVTDAEVYNKAKAFHDQVASGAIKAAAMQDESDDVSAGGQKVDDSNLPF